MATFTVTATQGGGTANGLALRVFVLTQAAAVQNGPTVSNQFTNATSFTQSITTTQTGSRVYGASRAFVQAAPTAAALTTLVDTIADSTNNDEYITFKATSLTGTPGATTLGFTFSGGESGPFVMAEILSAGTLTEDASGPAVASTTASTTVTTASFTPPAGALLVGLVGSNGAGLSVVTMALTDTSGLGLTWTELVKNNPSNGAYAGVWVARLPGAAQGRGAPAEPPGRQSPVSLGLGLTAPSPAPQSPRAGQAVTPPVAPPGRQSPTALGLGLTAPSPAPQSPVQQQATPEPPTPPGRTSPMSLGLGLTAPSPAPQSPPVQQAPPIPPTPPGRVSPMALGLGLTAPSPAPQAPAQRQATPQTELVPPGLLSPMALTAYQPPGSPAPAPVPPPPPRAAIAPLTPPGRTSPMSLGLGLYAPSPGQGPPPPGPPPPALVIADDGDAPWHIRSRKRRT